MENIIIGRKSNNFGRKANNCKRNDDNDNKIGKMQ